VEHIIVNLLRDFDQGKMTRRQLIQPGARGDGSVGSRSGSGGGRGR